MMSVYVEIDVHRKIPSRVRAARRSPAAAEGDRLDAGEERQGLAGSVITGRVSGLAPSLQVRQVFRAWQRTLGLGECSERRSAGGAAWLHAADRSGAVTVRLSSGVRETGASSAGHGGQLCRQAGREGRARRLPPDW
jgi:hypothetical protein